MWTEWIILGVTIAVTLIVAITPWAWTLQSRLTRIEVLIEQLVKMETSLAAEHNRLEALDRRLFVVERQVTHEINDR